MLLTEHSNISFRVPQNENQFISVYKSFNDLVKPAINKSSGIGIYSLSGLDISRNKRLADKIDGSYSYERGGFSGIFSIRMAWFTDPPFSTLTVLRRSNPALSI